MHLLELLASSVIGHSALDRTALQWWSVFIHLSLTVMKTFLSVCLVCVTLTHCDEDRYRSRDKLCGSSRAISFGTKDVRRAGFQSAIRLRSDAVAKCWMADWFEFLPKRACSCRKSGICNHELSSHGSTRLGTSHERHSSSVAAPSRRAHCPTGRRSRAYRNPSAFAFTGPLASLSRFSLRLVFTDSREAHIHLRGPRR